MKKFVKVMALALALVTVCAFAISCSVSGNTYEYEKYEIVGEENMTELEKSAAHLAAAAAETFGKGTAYEFKSDGTFGSLYWKQSGSKVYTGKDKDFKAEEGTLIGELKGGKFVVSYKTDKYSFNLIYKKK